MVWFGLQKIIKKAASGVSGSIQFVQGKDDTEFMILKLERLSLKPLDEVKMVKPFKDFWHNVLVEKEEHVEKWWSDDVKGMFRSLGLWYLLTEGSSAGSDFQVTKRLTTGFSQALKRLDTGASREVKKINIILKTKSRPVVESPGISKSQQIVAEARLPGGTPDDVSSSRNGIEAKHNGDDSHEHGDNPPAHRHDADSR
jgi:hypothetical protein